MFLLAFIIGILIFGMILLRLDIIINIATLELELFFDKD